MPHWVNWFFFLNRELFCITLRIPKQEKQIPCYNTEQSPHCPLLTPEQLNFYILFPSPFFTSLSLHCLVCLPVGVQVTILIQSKPISLTEHSGISYRVLLSYFWIGGEIWSNVDLKMRSVDLFACHLTILLVFIQKLKEPVHFFHTKAIFVMTKEQF